MFDLYTTCVMISEMLDLYTTCVMYVDLKHLRMC